MSNEMSMPRLGKHLSSVLLALFVTLLWSTSWVFIKLGLRASLPAITFAGLRYSLAFACLLPLVVMNPAHRRAITAIPPRMWAGLVLLGCVFYTLTQGAQFAGLAYLPAATLTLILNFTPVVVAFMGLFTGTETPSAGQWGGILLSVAGAVVYFAPGAAVTAPIVGLAVAAVGVLANSAASVLGRQVNSRSGLPALVVTTLSMGVGGSLLLVIGLITQGFGRIEPAEWALIAWLAVINTALAFTLWSRTQQTLTAVESSLINGLMLPQIGVLAWVFLGEALGAGEILGMAMVGAGVLIVQIGSRWKMLTHRQGREHGQRAR